MSDDPPKKQRNLAAERSQKVIFKNPCAAPAALIRAAMIICSAGTTLEPEARLTNR
jgi:hypothetical protein